LFLENIDCHPHSAAQKKVEVKETNVEGPYSNLKIIISSK
jgi:hypothetical protein